MSVLQDILDRARYHGLEIEARDDRLKLRSPQKPPDELLAELQAHKSAIIALLRPANDGWSAEDWQAFFDERAGIAEHDGEQTQTDAEAIAFECCIVEWLNRNPERSDPGRCAWCGKPDRNGHTVVPFGTENHGHTWLHPECWPNWFEHRRQVATEALARMGIKPSAHPKGKTN